MGKSWNYLNHELTYTPNGGSLDLREAVAGLYGELITADHVLIFPGCQVALQTAQYVELVPHRLAAV